MADELRIVERPALRRPILICAFRGWNDGGQGASLAAAYLAQTWNAVQFADVDPEEFFDFQVSRPHVSLVGGTIRRIDWPETSFHHAVIPGLDRDAVLLMGIEPNMRWGRFSELIAGLADEVGVELLITLGSLLADVPHTRSAPVTASASDQKLIEELGLERSRYEGPTGIVGVLHDSFYRRGFPAISLWAAVPHYVSLAPSPRAATAAARSRRRTICRASSSPARPDVEHLERRRRARRRDRARAARAGRRRCRARGGERPRRMRAARDEPRVRARLRRGEQRVRGRLAVAAPRRPRGEPPPTRLCEDVARDGNRRRAAARDASRPR